MAVKPSLLKHYLKLYRRKPNSQFFVPLADLYRRNGNTDKALQVCQKGIKNHPKFAMGHAELGMIWMDLKQLNLAQQSLELAVRLSPKYLLAHKLLGQVYLKQKNPEKTLSAYQMVLTLDPGNKTATRIIDKLSKAEKPPPVDDTGFTFQNLSEVSAQITPPSTSISTPTPTSTSLRSTLSHSTSDHHLPPLLHPLPKKTSKTNEEEFKNRCWIVEGLLEQNNFEEAKNLLTEMKNIYNHHQQKKDSIHRLEQSFFLKKKKIQEEQIKQNQKRSHQIKTLRHLLDRVNGYLSRQEY